MGFNCQLKIFPSTRVKPPLFNNNNNGTTENDNNNNQSLTCPVIASGDATKCFQVVVVSQNTIVLVNRIIRTLLKNWF